MATPDFLNRHWIGSGAICSIFLLLRAATSFSQAPQLADDEPGGRLRRFAAPQYDLIALRVEFQPDDSRFSTGDGIFGGNMFEDLNPRIDPYPHDAAYFEAHLAFLANYVNHVSGGQTSLRTHLLSEIVRVSGSMGDYAPTGPDADSPTERAKLIALVREAWTQADEQSLFNTDALNPDRTAFVLFHAGTGRDIELTGTVLDRTPEDLPSLFLGSEYFDELANPLLFNGLTVSNTLLIPETESKRGVDPISDEPFLLELSINGLLAASFFNFLGVPDLFDTQDGTSAIGPYGLMDPLGIFAYGGLLPPEPSAWTKFFLGWQTPLEITGPETQEITLLAGADQALVPISATEYFLVETRHRDPNGDGLNLSVLRNGEIVNVHVTPDSDDFTPFSQEAVEGVVINADDFDWALPGGFDDTGSLRQGGILIWHIDERIIENGFVSNTVNVDPHYRGVDVEEADGAQDLGFPSTNPFAPDLDRGTPFDFFFEGNPVTSLTSTGEVRLYENRFGPDTYPNSNSNGGGPSFIVLDEFSPSGTEMTFRYSRSAFGIEPIDFSMPPLDVAFGPGASITTFWLEIGPARVEHLILHTGVEDQTLWFVPMVGGIASRIDGVLGKPVIDTSPAGVESVAYLARNDADEVYFAHLDPVYFVPMAESPLPAEVRLALPTTQLVGVTKDGKVTYYVGFDLGAAGYVVSIASDHSVELLPFELGGVVSIAASPDGDLYVFGRDGAQIWSDAEVISEWTFPASLGETVGQAVVGRDALGIVGVITSVDDGRLLVLGEDGRVVEIWSTIDRISHWPILVDANGDGLLEVVVGAGESLLSYSREGAVTSGFPIVMPEAIEVQPLVAQLGEDQEPYAVIALADGYLHAVSLGRRGKERAGFPLAIGGGIPGTPFVSEGSIYAVSSAGRLAGWNVDDLGPAVWPALYGSYLNTSFVSGGDQPPPNGVDGDLIVDSETYNWPNPVRDGITHLRVATRERANVEITIIDLAGNLVHTMETDVAVPGIPIEFEWRPEVQSGVYYTRVQAETAAGRRDWKLYSIAVIR